nr:primosomal protein N' [Solobacterium sp.]
LSTAIACFQTMLPAKVKPVSGRKSIVMEKWVRLSSLEVRLTPKQLAAWTYVRDHETVRYSDLRRAFPNQAAKLVQNGALEVFELERAEEIVSAAAAEDPLLLNAAQQKVMDEILSSDDPVWLLRGVTGSGKTEIYLQLAARALAEGKQVLILVPEIALTPQMIRRVSVRFGEHLAIYHSGLNDQEKYEQYRLVRTGRASVVVGTRSAVFLPFASLGLIVMDEEHDSSYKQDSQPSYHCRDIAIQRGKYHSCKVILGSATPALESYARGLKNVYHLVELKERVNGTFAPVTVVSMRDAMRRGGSGILSDVLKEKMAQRLAKHEQCILLLNRRGYSSRLYCRSCEEPLMCPHCDLSMSWHRDIRRLKCHTCGTERLLPAVCPSCGSTAGFTTFGYGTQKLEEEVLSVFGDVRILRMDADTTGRKNSHAAILEAFGRHEADILLGTQMIAKGLDYPDVTLVGVISGDEGLRRTDFRSCETTFDLLMQAGGRSGRGEKNGEVVFQVFDPGHYAVQSAAKHDYLSFFQNEMQFRRAGQYPPYTYMIALTLTGRDAAATEKTAVRMKQEIRGDLKIIGVSSLVKINDLTRCRILLKGKNLDEMRRAVSDFLQTTELNLKGLKIDINPIYLE